MYAENENRICTWLPVFIIRVCYPGTDSKAKVLVFLLSVSAPSQLTSSRFPKPHVTHLRAPWNIQNTLPPCAAHNRWNRLHALNRSETRQLNLYQHLSAHSGTNVGSLEKKTLTHRHKHCYAPSRRWLPSVEEQEKKFPQRSQNHHAAGSEVNAASTTMRTVSAAALGSVQMEVDHMASPLVSGECCFERPRGPRDLGDHLLCASGWARPPMHCYRSPHCSSRTSSSTAKFAQRLMCTPQSLVVGPAGAPGTPRHLRGPPVSDRSKQNKTQSNLPRGTGCGKITEWRFSTTKHGTRNSGSHEFRVFTKEWIRPQ